MEKILGVDFGEKKIGLALSAGKLAVPYSVIRYNEPSKAITQIDNLVKREGVKKVVVGVSEGEMGEQSKEFSLSLRERIGIPVKFWDETLSTQEAQARAIEAGIRKIKRKRLEDAYAAAVMLQNFLDTHL